jgi:DNA-binding PadR family transcriptional regulator
MGTVRRRADTLLPLEAAILEALAAVRASDGGPLHGFALARRLADGATSQGLTAHGTLYKALARMQAGGLVTSSWEDPDIALAAGRPRRRLYEITASGVDALAGRARVAPKAAFAPRPARA